MPDPRDLLRRPAIKFAGEAGIDVGGLTKDMFSEFFERLTRTFTITVIMKWIGLGIKWFVHALPFPQTIYRTAGCLILSLISFIPYFLPMRNYAKL